MAGGDIIIVPRDDVPNQITGRVTHLVPIKSEDGRLGVEYV